jgi:hypothetical protein
VKQSIDHLAHAILGRVGVRHSTHGPLADITRELILETLATKPALDANDQAEIKKTLERIKRKAQRDLARCRAIVFSDGRFFQSEPVTLGDCIAAAWNQERADIDPEWQALEAQWSGKESDATFMARKKHEAREKLRQRARHIMRIGRWTMAKASRSRNLQRNLAGSWSRGRARQGRRGLRKRGGRYESLAADPVYGQDILVASAAAHC